MLINIYLVDINSHLHWGEVKALENDLILLGPWGVGPYVSFPRF